MIVNRDKEISFISIGSKIINTVYKGSVIVWQNIVGWWINDRPWNNDKIWRNQ